MNLEEIKTQDLETIEGGWDNRYCEALNVP